MTQAERQRGRVRITFTSVRFADLVAWLGGLPREGAPSPLCATISALDQPGVVPTELMLGP